MKSILNPNFKYVHSSETNIRDTFERARREMRQQVQAEAPASDLPDFMQRLRRHAGKRVSKSHRHS